MVRTIAMCYSLSICFLPSSTCLAATSHSNKTVPMRTEHVRPLLYCPGRHPTSYHRSCGHPTVQTLIQLTIKFEMYWRSAFIVPIFVTSITASQAYLERIFSLCGLLTARRRNIMNQNLEMRAFVKLHSMRLKHRRRSQLADMLLDQSVM